MIDFQQKQVQYYDSLGGRNDQLLDQLLLYVADEAKTHSNQENYDMSGWTKVTPKNIPRQKNGCDCGVFTAQNACFLAGSYPLVFTQNDMPALRRNMICEIISNRLFLPQAGDSSLTTEDA